MSLPVAVLEHCTPCGARAQCVRQSKPAERVRVALERPVSPALWRVSARLRIVEVEFGGHNAQDLVRRCRRAVRRAVSAPVLPESTSPHR
eukprot:2730632-Prymnesium_polylepis.2